MLLHICWPESSAFSHEDWRRPKEDSQVGQDLHEGGKDGVRSADLKTEIIDQARNTKQLLILEASDNWKENQHPWRIQEPGTYTKT